MFSRRQLPVPRFVVLFEGAPDDVPHYIQRLSKAFNGDGSALELTVKVFNIHSRAKDGIAAKCDYLRQYSMFSQKHRALRKNGMTGDEATRETIKFCRDNSIMTDYLDEHEQEVFRMLDMEWDADKAYAAYVQEGVAQGVLSSLKNLIKNAHILPQEAMNILEIPAEQRAHYLALLN